MPELVVLPALITIGKNGICFVSLFEFGLRRLVIRIQIRMILLCKLSVSLFKFVIRGTLTYTEYLIVITFLLCQGLFLLLSFSLFCKDIRVWTQVMPASIPVRSAKRFN